MSVFFLRTLAAAFLFTTIASADALVVGVHPDSVTVGTKTIPIPLPKPTGKRDSGTHTIPIGEGKKVVHVEVEQAGARWEAIVAGGPNDPLFAGVTGFAQGEEGERTGQVVLITDRDAETKFVLIGDVREDTRICGQAMTPLSVRGLDPRTMTFRGASMHRIDKKDRDAATAITAAPATGKPPLARLLAATGASSGKAPALTDGKTDTAWSEERPGDGHGEFVTMRAPTETPLHSLVVTPSATASEPRTLFVATDRALFQVTLPESKGPLEVTFPQPITTSCVSIVLDEAYGDERPVGIAEVAARTRFDVEGSSFDDVVKELSGKRADEAAAVLRRGGDDALAAVATAYARLDGRSRAMAVDVASSAGACNGSAMDLLTSALADSDHEVRRRALGRIERCGKNATESLILAVRSSDEARRAASAGLLASIAPAAAFDPLVSVLGEGRPETRHAVRAAFGKSAAAAPPEKLATALGTTRAPLELLRALGPKALEIRPQAQAALRALLAGTPDFATRYLAVEPLAAVADHPLLTAMATSDPDWPVRMHAVEALGANAPASAGSDPEPRVREAAMRAKPAPTALSDEWPFVRVAAAEGLGAAHQHPEALAKALRDRSAKVRAAAVRALGTAGARQYGDQVRERLDDSNEDTEVRALAARTLGQLCIASATDKLTRLAILAAHPVDEADERLGMAALDGLAALHPPDLEKRLAPLRVKGSKTLLTRAADRAVSEPGTCR